MTIPTLKQVLLRIVVVAGLGAALVGCASDVTAPDNSGATQMRYYGGPKSPMWRGPVEQ